MKGMAWTLQELDRLVMLRGHHLSWPAICVKLPGRTSAACRVAFETIAVRRVIAEKRQREIEARAAKALEAVFTAPSKRPSAPPAPPSLAEMNRRRRLAAQVRLVEPPAEPVREGASSAAISLARLVIDRELRSRIEILGTTGGMLGDPLPGQSALDKRNAGLVEAARVPWWQRRVKVTLAGSR